MTSVGIMTVALTIPTSWRGSVVKLLDPYATTIDMFLEAEQYMCDGIARTLPETWQIFDAFRHCDLEDTSVVIVGAPHAEAAWAQGLAYSVPPSCTKLPAGTQSIIREVARSYGTTRSADLTDLARQGVLLLNDGLTCREGCGQGPHQNPHQAAWGPFVDGVLQLVSEKLPAVVFMCWGNDAQAKAQLVDTKKHLVLKAPHPAATCKTFLGCNHFAVANNWLVSRRRMPIMWT
jgi:uracil-DNA glycosylase